jgi:hypothetical protein
MPAKSTSHLEKTFRCQNVYVSVFNNNGLRSAAASVSYKDGEDWKYGTSFGAKDLIVAASLMLKAADYIMAQDELDSPRKSFGKQARKRVAEAEPQTPESVADPPADPDEDVPF